MSYYGSYSTMASVPATPELWTDYRWMVVCAALASFFMSWGIGANDVANSFATSVGSKTLLLWQAVVVAGIFEFTGALALGGETTKTIASDISRVAMYEAVPEIYMYGMLCSLTIAGVWLLLATFYRLPVSTTHSIIGSIMGFSMVFGGINGVLWNEPRGDFPYSKGFLPVVLSWFFSPCIGGTLSAIIFNLNRFFILRRKNSTMKAIYSLPILLFFTFFINIMFVLAKGAKSQMAKTWPCNSKAGPGMFGLYYEDCNDLYAAATWIAACVGVFIGAVGGAGGIWYLKRQYLANVGREEAEATTMEAGGSNDPELNKGHARASVHHAHDGMSDAEKALGGSGPSALRRRNTMEESMARNLEAKAGHSKASLQADTDKAARVGNQAFAFPTCPEEGILAKLVFYITFVPICFYMQCKRGLFYDIFEVQVQDDATKAMHDNAEKFNPHTELVYQALQVLSACCVSFAHGSNDVANSIGPFSAIYNTYLTLAIPGSKSTTPEWMFVLGGVGIVFGLLMYGYNIIMELGVNMLHLTPSRGFSAELAAGLTISLASFFGIPVSTTQIIVGAEVGIGLSEGTSGGLSWRVLIKTALGWVWTIVLSLAFCACLFSMGAYAPSIIQTEQINNYRIELLSAQELLLKDINRTNYLWQQQQAWWNGEVANPPMPYNGSQLGPYINKTLISIKAVKTPKKHVTQDQVLYYVAQASALYQNYSITAIGQMNSTAVVVGAAAYQSLPASKKP